MVAVVFQGWLLGRMIALVFTLGHFFIELRIPLQIWLII
jgi:hypothetical protein